MRPWPRQRKWVLPKSRFSSKSTIDFYVISIPPFGGREIPFLKEIPFFPSYQFLDHFLVRGNKIKILQFFRPYPAEIHAIPRFRIAAYPIAKIKMKTHGFFRVGMLLETEKLRRPDPHPQLLINFARETLLHAFPFFDFAAREFPIPSEKNVRLALGD